LFYKYNITETYTRTEVERELSTFTLFINGTNTSLSAVNFDANLIYNNTIYTATKVVSGETATFTKTIAIPLVTTDELTEDKTFYWNFTLTGSDKYNTSEKTQTITKVYVGLCSNATFNVSILNVTLQDEDNLSSLSSDLDVAFEGIYVDDILYSFDISFNFSDITNVSFCLNTNYTARFDAMFVHTKERFTQRIYNFLENLTYTSTYFLDLFLSKDGNITNIYVTLYDENSERLDNYYVKADRFYTDLSDYKNIETVKSDVNGEVLLHLIPFTKEYRLRIIDFYGNTVKVIPRTIIKSSTITISFSRISISFTTSDTAGIMKSSRLLLHDRIKYMSQLPAF